MYDLFLMGVIELFDALRWGMIHTVEKHSSGLGVLASDNVSCNTHRYVCERQLIYLVSNLRCRSLTHSKEEEMPVNRPEKTRLPLPGCIDSLPWSARSCDTGSGVRSLLNANEKRHVTFIMDGII